MTEVNKYVAAMAFLAESRASNGIATVPPKIMESDTAAKIYLIECLNKGMARLDIIRELNEQNVDPVHIKAMDIHLSEIAKLNPIQIRAKYAELKESVEEKPSPAKEATPAFEMNDDLDDIHALSYFLHEELGIPEDVVAKIVVEHFSLDIFKQELTEGGPGSGRRGHNMDKWRASYVEKHMDKHGYNSPGHIEAYSRAWALPKGHKPETTQKHMEAMKLLQSGRYSLSQIAKKTGLRVQQVYQNRKRLDDVESSLQHHFQTDGADHQAFRNSMRDISNRRVAAAEKGSNKNFGTQRRSTIRKKQLAALDGVINHLKGGKSTKEDRRGARNLGAMLSGLKKTSSGQIVRESVETEIEDDFKDDNHYHENLENIIGEMAEDGLTETEIIAELREMDEDLKAIDEGRLLDMVRSTVRKAGRFGRKVTGMQKRAVGQKLQSRALRHYAAADKLDQGAKNTMAHSKQLDRESTRLGNMARYKSHSNFQDKAVETHAASRNAASSALNMADRARSSRTTARNALARHNSMTGKDKKWKTGNAFKAMREDIEKDIASLIEEDFTDDEIYNIICESYDSEALDAWLETLEEETGE